MNNSRDIGEAVINQPYGSPLTPEIERAIYYISAARAGVRGIEDLKKARTFIEIEIKHREELNHWADAETREFILSIKDKIKELIKSMEDSKNE